MTKLIYLCFPTIVCFFLLMAGCALDAHRIHPEFERKAGSIKSAVLVPPEVDMFDRSSIRVAVLRDDWSNIGRENLQIAIKQNLAQKQCRLKLMQMDENTTEQMADVRALYELVHRTMTRRTFNSDHKSTEIKKFDYSLGSIETILQQQAADSMIFVTGYDEIFENRRKALIDLAIADSSGTILYFSVKGTTQGKDLRDPADAEDVVRDLLSDFTGTQR